MPLKVDKKNIFKQMFDIRPTKAAGILNTQKILNVEKRLDLRKIEKENKALKRKFLLDLGKLDETPDSSQKKQTQIEDIYITQKDISEEEKEKFLNFYENINAIAADNIKEKYTAPELPNIKEGDGGIINFNPISYSTAEDTKQEEYLEKVKITENKKHFKNFKEKLAQCSNEIADEISQKFSPVKTRWKRSLAFCIAGCFIVCSSVGAFAYYQKGTEKAIVVKDLGMKGFYHLIEAKDSIEGKNFIKAQEDFTSALDFFQQAEEQISPSESLFAKLPDLFGKSTTVSSGIHLMQTGKSISKAGIDISKAVLPLFDAKVNIEGKNTTIITALSSGKDLLDNALKEINTANSEIKKTDVKNFPANIAQQIDLLRQKLPEAITILDKTVRYSDNILKILGNENPKKYLLLFQNNSELRANGGFIGSYGVIDIYKGKFSDIKIDGIYNPAGQLIEKVIPPLPFKKVTDKWNIFDANYFADFPTSAEKIAWFYEKTGGPTVDGIVTFTPQVLESLLSVTGPIKLDKFGKTIDQHNFIDELQYEVEEGYDKTENKPKKIIAVLAQKILEEIMTSSQENWQEYLFALQGNLAEKHILMYFSNIGQQRMVEEEKWAGNVLASEKDYLQIVHTNINGYKTDKVIDENIGHYIKIQPNGSIVDTINLTKKHNGGNSEFDWYNKQNGDFIRIYVPLGSELIEADGFSREKVYSKTKDFSEFTTDIDIEIMEKNMARDPQSGIFIFEESEKTVFAGWIYTDPGETSSIKITYKLPFKLFPSEPQYTVLYQKQSGHPGVGMNIIFEVDGEILEKESFQLIEDEKLGFVVGE